MCKVANTNEKDLYIKFDILKDFGLYLVQQNRTEEFFEIMQSSLNADKMYSMYVAQEKMREIMYAFFESKFSTL